MKGRLYQIASSCGLCNSLSKTDGKGIVMAQKQGRWKRIERDNQIASSYWRYVIMGDFFNWSTPGRGLPVSEDGGLSANTGIDGNFELGSNMVLCVSEVVGQKDLVLDS
ncbi:hypothetical protein QYF36_010089 [Acer negundo]|nr:hypothetical protein QYF36_010089 [Acer negundo]